MHIVLNCVSLVSFWKSTTMARRAVIASLVAGLAAAKNFTFNIRSDGNGDFSSVQAALDFIDPLSQPGGTCSGLVTLNIEGVFFERINVYSNFTGGVVFRGTGSSPMDSFLVYNESGVISGGGTFKSWTVKVDAPDVHFVNLAIANNASDYDAKIAGQSVALHLTADRFACWNCSLLGSQDTLYTVSARPVLRFARNLSGLETLLQPRLHDTPSYLCRASLASAAISPTTTST